MCVVKPIKKQKNSVKNKLIISNSISYYNYTFFTKTSFLNNDVCHKSAKKNSK